MRFDCTMRASVPCHVWVRRTVRPLQRLHTSVIAPFSSVQGQRQHCVSCKVEKQLVHLSGLQPDGLCGCREYVLDSMPLVEETHERRVVLWQPEHVCWC